MSERETEGPVRGSAAEILRLPWHWLAVHLCVRACVRA